MAGNQSNRRGEPMLAELGRRGDAALTRGADAANQAVYATVLHLRRIVGAVSVAVTRVTREAHDLAWDYQDVAADLRRPARAEGTPSDQAELRPALRVLRAGE
jgi:hypothetical protein